jgi:hypothetical protein
VSFGETFLRYPDLFPARRSGEPWGEREVVLDLPGGPYRFSGLAVEQEAGVLGRFGSLRVEGAAAVGTELFRAAPTDFLPIDVRGWSYGLDLDYGPASLRVAGLDLLARLDWRPGIAGALWTCEPGGERFPGMFENYCRLLVAYRLHELGGAVIHGAALVDNGEALLFAGPSGAGKTTVSRMGLARGRTVLSDDLNALLPPAGGRVRLAGLPFTGDLGGDGGGAGDVFPLRGLFRLEKGTTDALRPLSRAETVACLLAGSPFVNADPHRRDALLSHLLTLAEGMPAFALRFTLQGGMWDILAQECFPSIREPS